MEKINEIKQRIDEIKPSMIRLQWDKEHDQLNPGKLSYLQDLEKEYTTLSEQLESLKTTNLEEQNATLQENK